MELEVVIVSQAKHGASLKVVMQKHIRGMNQVSLKAIAFFSKFLRLKVVLGIKDLMYRLFHSFHTNSKEQCTEPASSLQSESNRAGMLQ